MQKKRTLVSLFFVPTSTIYQHGKLSQCICMPSPEFHDEPPTTTDRKIVWIRLQRCFFYLVIIRSSTNNVVQSKRMCKFSTLVWGGFGFLLDSSVSNMLSAEMINLIYQFWFAWPIVNSVVSHVIFWKYAATPWIICQGSSWTVFRLFLKLWILLFLTFYMNVDLPDSLLDVFGSLIFACII